MFRALVELGQRLDAKGELPPPGFYDYSEPIRWAVHLLPTETYIESIEVRSPRPYCGRTSSIEAHLLSDEAGYALGARLMKDGGKDQRAEEKHEKFRDLYRRLLTSDWVDPALRDAIELLDRALEQELPGKHERFQRIQTKDWVAFVPEVGPLSGELLFQHPDAKAFWLAEMQSRSSRGKNIVHAGVPGECSVCGRRSESLVRKLPLGVKLVGTVPLHSINASAFTSFIDGSDSPDRAHLGVCFSCGETAARAFNFLSSSERHRRILVQNRQKRDALGNQIALFWLKVPAPVRVAERTFDVSDFEALDFGVPVSGPPNASQTDLSQLHALLKLPWHPVDSGLHLDDYGFFLAVLSPNVGRIALREWMPTTLESVKQHLSRFLELTRMVSGTGDTIEPTSIRQIIEAIGSANPNLTRSLLRCAYTGAQPPASLAAEAGYRLNDMLPNERSRMDRQRTLGRDRAPVWGERWTQALAAAIRLSLFFSHGAEDNMEQVNPLFQSKAYHCGRLIAVLEEAQQVYHYIRSGERLKTTLVNRSYGGASSSPSTAFGPLLRLATVSHLPEAGGWINREVESISSTIVELGGYPQTLTALQQAEFGLGFYHERAALRARWSPSDEAQAPFMDSEGDE